MPHCSCRLLSTSVNNAAVSTRSPWLHRRPAYCRSIGTPASWLASDLLLTNHGRLWAENVLVRRPTSDEGVDPIKCALKPVRSPPFARGRASMQAPLQSHRDWLHARRSVLGQSSVWWCFRTTASRANSQTARSSCTKILEKGMSSMSFAMVGASISVRTSSSGQGRGLQLS